MLLFVTAIESWTALFLKGCGSIMQGTRHIVEFSFLITMSDVSLLIHLYISLDLIKYTKNPFFREELEAQR